MRDCLEIKKYFTKNENGYTFTIYTNEDYSNPLTFSISKENMAKAFFENNVCVDINTKEVFDK